MTGRSPNCNYNIRCLIIYSIYTGVDEWCLVNEQCPPIYIVYADSDPDTERKLLLMSSIIDCCFNHSAMTSSGVLEIYLN